MNKFTPGPWTVKDSNVICSDGMSPTGANSNIMDTPSRNSANAHLIAAAPDMYEALDSLVAVVGLTAFNHEGQRQVLQEAVDLTVAALKKAMGEI